MRFLIPCALGLGVACAAPCARALDLSGAYESERDRDTGLPAQGFSAGLSQGLADWLSLGVGYSQLRTQPFADGGLEGRQQFDSASASLGAGVSLSDAFSLSASAGYAQSEVRGLDEFADAPVSRSHGPSGSLSLAYWPHRWIQLSAGPAYSYIGGAPAWQGSVGASVKLLRGVWFTAGYWGAQSKDGWNAGLSLGGE